MKKAIFYLLIFICGGLFIPMVVHQVGASKRIGIVEADGTRHYVPEAIAAKKDCEAFRTWRDGLTKPGFVPAAVNCPWAPKPKGIGKFILNGVELHIPREYLWQGGDQPDGPVKDKVLYLMVSYPSMQPASADGDQTNNIAITVIGGVGGGVIEFMGKKMSVSGVQSTYHSEAFFAHNPLPDDKPIFISHVKNLNLDYYEVPSTGYKKDIFLKGDPIAPDEWVVCEHNYNSRCNTALQLNDKIFLSLSYRRFPNLENQEKLSSAITKVVASFIQVRGVQE